MNFKRDEPRNNENAYIATKKDFESNKNEPELVDQKNSCSNSNQDNVDILSPQSTDDYSNALLQSDNSITSPFSDFGNTSRSNINKLTSSDNMKKVFNEEFNFLPRTILQIKDTNSSSDLGPQTPDQYLDDSFLPTPTQDESHSPINVANNAIISRLGKSKSKMTNSIMSTSPNSEFYDPEVPLQSPDRVSIKSPSKDKIVYNSAASPKDSPNVSVISRRDIDIHQEGMC